MGHRGERSTYRSRNSRNPRRNGHRKTADANAVLDSNSSNCYANTTCYFCGKKGHIVPNCPDKKKGKEKKETHQKTAQGHVARSTEDAPSPPELVCLARHIPLPEIRPPRSGPAPAITVDPHARELVNTRIFVSLAIRVDNSVLSHEQERAYERYYLPETYEGDLEPLEEPLWVLLHNRPLNDLKPRFARITHPDHSEQIVFTEGIIPGLKRGFGIEPQQYPKLFKYWHSKGVHRVLTRKH